MLSACAPYTQEDSHRLAHGHADLAIASGTHVDMQTHAVTTGMHACPHIGMRPHMYTCPFACVHTRSWGGWCYVPADQEKAVIEFVKRLSKVELSWFVKTKEGKWGDRPDGVLLVCGKQLLFPSKGHLELKW